VNNGWVDAAHHQRGDGTHEHPTQALLDAFTMRSRLRGETARGMDLSGIAVAIVGDILHSRVARSNALLLRTLGASVTLAAPKPCCHVRLTAGEPPSCQLSTRQSRTRPDVVMTLRVQKENVEAGFSHPNLSSVPCGE